MCVNLMGQEDRRLPVGGVAPDTIMEVMLISEDASRLVALYVHAVLRMKQKY